MNKCPENPRKQGYPRGLKGAEIPFGARLFAVVDVWDALLSSRPYKEAWPVEKACAYLRSQKNIHFDPEMVDTFLENFVAPLEDGAGDGRPSSGLKTLRSHGSCYSDASDCDCLDS